MEWLRKRIIKWLKVPQYTENYYVNNCVFYREDVGDEPYLKKIGKIVKDYIGQENIQI